MEGENCLDGFDFTSLRVTSAVHGAQSKSVFFSGSYDNRHEIVKLSSKSTPGVSSMTVASP